MGLFCCKHDIRWNEVEISESIVEEVVHINVRNSLLRIVPKKGSCKKCNAVFEKLVHLNEDTEALTALVYKLIAKLWKK